MTTLRIDMHVPKEMVDWVRQHTPRTEEEALKIIKRLPQLADGWHTLVIDSSGEVIPCHVDHAYGATGYDEVYEGEPVILT